MTKIQSRHADVLVISAGPTGLMLANLLGTDWAFDKRSLLNAMKPPCKHHARFRSDNKFDARFASRSGWTRKSRRLPPAATDRSTGAPMERSSLPSSPGRRNTVSRSGTRSSSPNSKRGSMQRFRAMRRSQRFSEPNWSRSPRARTGWRPRCAALAQSRFRSQPATSWPARRPFDGAQIAGFQDGGVDVRRALADRRPPLYQVTVVSTPRYSAIRRAPALHCRGRVASADTNSS